MAAGQAWAGALGQWGAPEPECPAGGDCFYRAGMESVACVIKDVLALPRGKMELVVGGSVDLPEVGRGAGFDQLLQHEPCGQ